MIATVSQPCVWSPLDRRKGLRERSKERKRGKADVYQYILYVWWIIKVLQKEVSESWIVLASWWTSLYPLWQLTHINMPYALAHIHLKCVWLTHSVLESPHFHTTYCRSSSELISYTEPWPLFHFILTRKLLDSIYDREHQVAFKELFSVPHCPQVPWKDFLFLPSFITIAHTWVNLVLVRS